MDAEILYDDELEDAELVLDEDEGYFIIIRPNGIEIKLNIADVENVLK